MEDADIFILKPWKQNKKHAEQNIFPWGVYGQFWGGLFEICNLKVLLSN